MLGLEETNCATTQLRQTEVRIEGVRASTAAESSHRPASISLGLTRYIVTISSQIVRMNKGVRQMGWQYYDVVVYTLDEMAAVKKATKEIQEARPNSNVRFRLDTDTPQIREAKYGNCTWDAQEQATEK